MIILKKDLSNKAIKQILFLLSRALQEADVVVLLGARLNWMLHFGAPPRFNPKVKVIQVRNALFHV